MDVPSQAPPPANLPGTSGMPPGMVLPPSMMPPPHQHRGLKLATVWAIIISGIIMGVYLLGIHGFLGFLHFSNSPNTSGQPDLVFVAPTSDGTTWYEMNGANGKPVKHDDYPHATIVAVARSAGKAFVLTQIKTSSNLYEENGISYNLLYTTKALLSTLSVSDDGKIAGFTEGAGANAHIVAVVLATQKATDLGNGFGETVINAGHVPSIVYLDGSNVVAQTLNVNTWTKPVTVYTSSKAFPSTAVVATDGEGNFAFVDPLVHSASIWTVKNLNPLVGSPVKIYNQAKPLSADANLNVGFAGGNLFLLDESPTTETMLTQLSPLGSTAIIPSMKGASPISFISL